jgi:hypothetical protein
MLWLVLRKHIITPVFRAVLNCYLCYYEDSFVMMPFPLCIQFVAGCRMLWWLCCIVTKLVLAEITRLVQCGSINTQRHSHKILSKQHLKGGILTVNVSRGTGGILTVHCCWTASHMTYSQCQLLAISATNIILLSHHVAHSSGLTESRAMGGAETSCIECGLATSNGTVMLHSVIKQRFWQQPMEFLQVGICQLCMSAAAV